LLVHANGYSSLGLITGGAIADTRGWRWSGWIAAIIEAGTFLLILGGFEETMFPRFLFDKPNEVVTDEHGAVVDELAKRADEEVGKKGLAPTHTDASERVGDVLPGYGERTIMQKLRFWSYQPEDKTTYWQYFKRRVRSVPLDKLWADKNPGHFSSLHSRMLSW
jgi:MFS family permease